MSGQAPQQSMQRMVSRYLISFLFPLGSLLVAIIGLVFLRKSLLYYFEERAVGLALLGIVLSSNYLNYTAIDGAITHNYLFTLYALLIYASILFYQRPTFLRSLIIGLLVGMATLTRPTEIISCLIPLASEIPVFSKSHLLERWHWLRSQLPKLMTAAVVAAAVISLQAIYWKYVSGDWVVYSYQDQVFSWLRPHLHKGIFNYKSGWLVYSPFMVFSLLGFYYLYKKASDIIMVCLMFFLLFIYIAFAWDIWWYGGSLGQRTMVQAYAILAFPLTAFFSAWLRYPRWWQVVFALAMAVLVGVNLWFTHQAHRGGQFHTGLMTQAYYWQTLINLSADPEHLKLLDGMTSLFSGKRTHVQTLYENNDSTMTLNKELQYAPKLSVPVKDHSADWYRVAADFAIEQKEWNIWMMTQFYVLLKSKEETICQNVFRIQRHLHDGQRKRLYLDIQKPKIPITDLEVIF